MPVSTLRVWLRLRVQALLDSKLYNILVSSLNSVVVVPMSIRSFHSDASCSLPMKTDATNSPTPASLSLSDELSSPSSCIDATFLVRCVRLQTC